MENIYYKNLCVRCVSNFTSLDFNTIQQRIPWQEERLKMFGKEVISPRKVCYFGTVPYAYSGLLYPASPFPTILEHLRKQAEEVFDVPLNSALCNYYPTGSHYMGWHRDNEKTLGPDPKIVSLSLGGDRFFEFRHRNTQEVFRLLLKHQSAFLMHSGTDQLWEHRLPKMKGHIAPRVNITFRQVVTP